MVIPFSEIALAGPESHILLIIDSDFLLLAWPNSLWKFKRTHWAVSLCSKTPLGSGMCGLWDTGIDYL